jgi:membrane-associated phospholipid phosphatase
MPNPLEALGDDTVASFTGTNLAYHGFAIASLAVLSPTGADHEARVWVQETIHAPLWGDAAYYGGYLIPALLAPSLYLTGLATDDRSLAGAGSAAILALGLTVSTTVVLKVGTGRPFPLHGQAPDAPDRLDHPEYSKEFVPFGFAGRYAWPSGHTSANIAVAAALTAYARGSVWVPLTAYPIAIGISTGMLVGDHHWLSDVLAGAAIGQAIGWTVGTNFRARHECEVATGKRPRCSSGPPRGVASWSVVPLMGEAHGAAIVGALW